MNSHLSAQQRLVTQEVEPLHAPDEQKIAYARSSLWTPFYTVGMAARVEGNVPAELAEAALRKLQIMHPPLGSRVRVNSDGAAWLTTQGVGPLPLTVRPRLSEDDCYTVMQEQERLPFDYEKGPLARCFLLRGDESSDLIVIAPHLICDGYSMAHAMGDAVALLNDPQREVTPRSAPPPVTWENVPHAFYDHLLLRGLVRAVNLLWRGVRVHLDQKAYEELHQQYWGRAGNALLPFTLAPDQVADLLARCRQRGVSITGALMAAFLLARRDVWPASPDNPREVSVAANIRDRMKESPGVALGVYASIFSLWMQPTAAATLWPLAAECHRRIHKNLRSRTELLKTLVFEELDPLIADATVAAMCTDQWSPEFRLITHYAHVRGDARSLNVSNIGRVDLPDLGAPHRLQNLLPFPPLMPGSTLALNVLTIHGRMNVALKCRREDGALLRPLKERALGYLLES